MNAAVPLDLRKGAVERPVLIGGRARFGVRGHSFWKGGAFSHIRRLSRNGLSANTSMNL